MSNSDLSILFFKFFIEFGLRKKLKKFVKNGCQVEKSMLYYHSCCGSAGIGRQARLRILWVYARVGSSPISRIDWIVRKPYIIRLFGLSFLFWFLGTNLFCSQKTEFWEHFWEQLVRLKPFQAYLPSVFYYICCNNNS